MMFSPVVGPGDGVKLLLARGVPQHQPHRGAVVGSDHLLQEVHPDGFLVGWCEHSLAVSPDQTRLSNSSVSNNHNLITKILNCKRKDGIKKIWTNSHEAKMVQLIPMKNQLNLDNVIVRLGASCSFEIITAKIMLSTLVTHNMQLRAANYDLIKVKFPKLII